MQDEQGGGEVRELPPYPARAGVPVVCLGALLGLDWSAGFEAWLGKSLGWLNLSCRPYRKGGGAEEWDQADLCFTSSQWAPLAQGG